MDFEKWRPWYKKIVKAFKFDEERDQRAADILSRMLIGKATHPENIRRVMNGQRVIVFGAGPSVERNIREAIDVENFKDYVVMAADGSTTALLKFDVIPNVIVTDLDGRIEDMNRSQSRGTSIIVHAHGDNIPALRRVVPKFRKEILGTTQVQPRPHVYNFGGFTDGDRCAFLAEEMGAKRIVLAGMDLGEVTGKHSKPSLSRDTKATAVKRRKLMFAKELLEWLAGWSKAEILNATGSGEKIRGITDISLEDI